MRYGDINVDAYVKYLQTKAQSMKVSTDEVMARVVYTISKESAMKESEKIETIGHYLKAYLALNQAKL